MDSRRTCISHLIDIAFKRIEHLLALGITHLKMKMRTSGASCIATPGHHLTGLHRNLIRCQREIHLKTLLRILLFLQIGSNTHIKALQMAINSGRSIGMRQIERIAISPRAYRNTNHITLLHGMDRFSLRPLCLEINAGMEMIASQLAKATAQ